MKLGFMQRVDRRGGLVNNPSILGGKKSFRVKLRDAFSEGSHIAWWKGGNV